VNENRNGKEAKTMALHESAEMYLETIYQLSLKKGIVRSVDVAESMGYSKPSISRAVGLLKQGGYLLMEKDGALTLTEMGMAAAEKVVERHESLTNLLIGLGVSPETAAEDACKMEHVISDETFAAMKKHMRDYAG
jgi:Mn-dependent DtxR family transcriptional regulator